MRGNFIFISKTFATKESVIKKQNVKCIFRTVNFENISYRVRSYQINHIKSYLTISYHMISYHFISYITSYHISHHIISSYHIKSYHVKSYHITSHHIISHHIISYHIISYHIISHINSNQIICHIRKFLYHLRSCIFRIYSSEEKRSKKKLRSRGPKTEPYGTPFRIFFHVLNEPLILSLCRFFNK